MPDDAFSGGQVAVLFGERLLTYLRDDFQHIPFPGHWDLPGGGRENDESPEACVLRELFEEFGVSLDSRRIVWKRRYPSLTGSGPWSYFFVAIVSGADIEDIAFGNEGQCWEMMSISSFLNHPHAVPHLQTRLRDFLLETGWAHTSG